MRHYYHHNDDDDDTSSSTTTSLRRRRINFLVLVLGVIIITTIVIAALDCDCDDSGGFWTTSTRTMGTAVPSLSSSSSLKESTTTTASLWWIGGGVSAFQSSSISLSSTYQQQQQHRWNTRIRQQKNKSSKSMIITKFLVPNDYNSRSTRRQFVSSSSSTTRQHMKLDCDDIDDDNGDNSREGIHEEDNIRRARMQHNGKRKGIVRDFLFSKVPSWVVHSCRTSQKSNISSMSSSSTSTSVVRPPQPRQRRRRRRWAVVLAVTVAALTGGIGSSGTVRGGGSRLNYRPPCVYADLMAIPKPKQADPVTVAIDKYNAAMRIKHQEELNEYSRKCRDIQQTQGTAALKKFEKEYEQAKQLAATKRIYNQKRIKYELLLHHGIDPFVDREGQRQVLLDDKGIDLANVPGTIQSLEKIFETSKPKDSFQYLKQNQRQLIKCIVQDMKNKQELESNNNEEDIMDSIIFYFENHKAQTLSILDMSSDKAADLVKEYETNLEQYGQITIPADGELSVFEKKKMLLSSSQKKKKKPTTNDKQEQKRIKAEAKAKEQEEKARLRAEAKAAKAKEAQAKKDAKATKKQSTTTMLAATAASAAASSSTTTTAAGSAAAAAAAKQTLTAGSGMMKPQSTTPGGTSTLVADASSYDTSMNDEGTEVGTISSSSVVPSQSQAAGAGLFDTIPIIPASAVLIAAGGGAYGIKFMRQRAQEVEEERRKQFQLLMGGADGTDSLFDDDDDDDLDLDNDVDPFLDDDDDKEPIVDTDDEVTNGESSTITPKPVPPLQVVEPPSSSPPAPAAKSSSGDSKKKGSGGRLGIKGIFSSKKSGRETDLTVLLTVQDPNVQEYTALLAKLLTFGAPGRFPTIQELPGGMPMNEFNLESAKEMLTTIRVTAGMELEQCAEIFANVVSCMLIEIVDLASSSLKERKKTPKATVNAIHIVIDFMNHAASLYDAVAESITIEPVTYGGKLSRSKLEQLYTAYVESGIVDISKIDDDFDSRSNLLRSVFEIPEKKANGFMMKALQKNAMEAFKSGDMSGMESMLEGLGGMEGMKGLLGSGGEGGDDIDYDKLKTMLLDVKKLKDEGKVPPNEINDMKKQFTTMFGSDIDTLINDVSNDSKTKSEMSTTDIELLELMKSIVG